MPVRNTSGIQFVLRKQSAWDTVDNASGSATTGPWKVPITSDNLTQNVQTTEIGEQTGVRQSPGTLTLGLNGQGSVTSTARFGTSLAFINHLLDGAMFASETSIDPAAGTGISFTSPDTIATTGSELDDVKAGDFIRSSGSTSNDGVHLISSKTDASTAVVDTNYSTITTEAAGASISIDTNRRRNGSTFTYYGLERQYTATTAQYLRVLNAVINGFTLDMPRDNVGTWQMDFLSDALGDSSFNTAASSVYTATLQNVEGSGVNPRTRVQNLRDVRVDGTAQTGVRSINLQMGNNIESLLEPEALNVMEFSAGDFTLSGSIAFDLIDDWTLVNHALAQTTFTLSFAIHDADGIAAGTDSTEALYFLFDARFDDPGDIGFGGRNQTLSPSMNFTAQPRVEGDGETYLLQTSRLVATS